MTTTDVIIYGLMVLTGVVLSALFSGMETGIYTINRVRLMVRTGRGDSRAARIRGLLQNPSRTLSTLLVGNNIANYAGSYGIAALLDGAGFSPVQVVLINAAVLIPILFVFGETLPKDLFRTHTDQWSYACSGFLLWAQRVLTWIGLVPLVAWFGRAVARLINADADAPLSSRQRISHLISEGMGTGIVSEAQTTLADRALAMRHQTLADEMVPWSKVATIAASADRARREAVFSREAYSRFPLIDDRGRPVGVLHLLDALLDPDATSTNLMHDLVTFGPFVAARDALRTMQADHITMAVVIDPRTERPLGIVTMKDLVEPLTGELAAW